MLLRDLSAVWHAARVDRFIGEGEAVWEKPPKTTECVDPRADQGSVPASEWPRSAFTTSKRAAIADGVPSDKLRHHALMRAGAALG